VKSMFPDGKSVAHMQCPFSELLVFCADRIIGVHVSGFGGEGYMLLAKSMVFAAYFNDDYRMLKGPDAVEFLKQKPFLEYDIRKYTPDELREVIAQTREMGWLIRDEIDPASGRTAEALEEVKLQGIASQPGVIGVSAFYEGFPVLSIGDGDFEQVAAIAEDLLRAGVRIASDLQIGDLEKVILETPEGKLIIAPFGDLYLCVYTTPDAHLGLIRLALKGIQ
jgi:predicted regulator of Ras-like GTPase activity (Roadblock/LC7/MglB family)